MKTATTEKSESWQSRLRQEHREIGERRQKLADFTRTEEFEGLPGMDQALLRTQLYAMNAYYGALHARVLKLDDADVPPTREEAVDRPADASNSVVELKQVKPWDELTPIEQLERMREVVKDQGRMLQRLQQHVERLNVHEHGAGGQPLSPIGYGLWDNPPLLPKGFVYF